MTSRSVWLAATSLIALSCVASAVLADTTPTPPSINEKLRDVRALTGTQLSPDGRQAALVIQDSTADGGRTHIWLSRADGGGVRQATFSSGEGDQGERAPAWSPDGASLYFQAKRGGAGRLMRLPMDGGEATALTLARADDGALTSGWGAAADAASPASVSAYWVSPDGRWIAVIATDGETAARKAEIKRKNDAVQAGRDDVKRERLYVVEAATGSARLVDLPDQAREARWSPKGDALAVVTAPADEDLGPAHAAWVVAAGDLSRKRLNDLPPTVSALRWTAKGWAYLAQCADEAPPGCMDLYAQDAGAPTARNLTRQLQGSIEGLGEVTTDGRAAYVAAHLGLRSVLMRADLNAGSLQAIELPWPVAFGLSTNAAQSGFVVEAGGPTAPRAAYAISPTEIAAGKVTSPVKLALPTMRPEGLPTPASRLLRWTHKGLTLEGLIYLPDLAAGTRAPLVVNVHGGPAGQFDDRQSNLVGLLVAQGYAVLQPNPRGGSGYGTRFLAANRNDLGGGDYEDIMAGVDAALAAYPLDPSRMALIGYSYGGEMAGFVAGRTTRFKALVSGAPVIDQFSEYGTEDSSFYDRWYYGRPWEHVADAWRQSPLARVGQAKTPMLLLQGEDDPTDPLGQSQEMWRALRQVGAPVTLITFPRETHASLGRGFAGEPTVEPWHGFELRARMLKFIADAFAGKDPTQTP